MLACLAGAGAAGAQTEPADALAALGFRLAASRAGPTAAEYRLEQTPAGPVVVARTERSFAHLRQRLSASLENAPCLRFSWRVDAFPGPSDEAAPGVYDFAARVYAVTDAPDGILNYVWARDLPVGTVLRSSFSKNRMLVIRSGPPRTEELARELRNVLADYERVFGVRPATLLGVWLMSDSDNHGGVAAARYTAPQLGACPMV